MGWFAFTVNSEGSGAITEVGQRILERVAHRDWPRCHHHFVTFDNASLVDVLNELGDVPSGGLGQNLFGCADLDDCAIFHDADSITDA